MRKKIDNNQKDTAAFHQAMKGAKPLSVKHNKIRLVKPNSNQKIVIKQPDLAKECILNDSIEGLAPVASEEFIAYKQASISYKVLRRLRKGHYPVDAVLDLHGMTIRDAKTAVQQFLHHCLQDKARVVLIIHGKGRHGLGPLLKNKLNHWLRHIHVILAFCSATALHGSRGAVYVLLKSDTEGLVFG